jgi:hypothetical protein
MPEIWEAFLSDYPGAAEILQDEHFLEQAAGTSSGQSQVPSAEDPNVEELIDKVAIAITDWQRRKPTSRKLKRLREAYQNLQKAVINAAILDPELWTDSDLELRSLDGHTRFLQRLVASRQPGQASPWVFTTNYDLGFEWAAERAGIRYITGFRGVHRRLFAPQAFDIGSINTKARGEARFASNDFYLAKLHGSLSWRRERDDVRELSCREAWGALRNLREPPIDITDSFVVFPSATKYVQTIGYLYGELFRRFSDFLMLPQSVLLITGYSFRDQHINRLLLSALSNPTLHMIVFYPEFTGEDQGTIPNRLVRTLVKSESPRVTLVGGGQEAYFDKVVELLPDPAIFDMKEREMRHYFADQQSQETTT